MRSIILRVTLAAMTVGLWAATPASGQTVQQQQLFIRARQWGMWNRISIFSQPQFQFMTDPRGANFGFAQQILWGPSLRSVFSPWGQTTIFRSNASSALVWTPAMGPVARINTPAMFGFSVNSAGGMRQFSFPSISVLSNLNGSTSFVNPNTPTFLSGTFNITVPLNGTATIPMSSTSVSTALSTTAAASALNSTVAATSAVNMSRAATATLSTASSNSTSAASSRFMTIQDGLAQGFTLDQILHSPLSQTFGVRAARGGLTNATWWGPRGTQVPAGNFTADTLPLARQYNGYVPANQIIP